MLTMLRKKAKTYAGRHADDHRAPTGTKCVDCGRAEPTADEEKQLRKGERPLRLALCSMCDLWRCSTCYSQHRYLPPPKLDATSAPWWKRVIGRAA